MSNLGQIALTLVGAVVGFEVGGPVGALYGSQLGLLAGRALFPSTVNGPQISDLNTTTSQQGAPVTIIFGTIGIPGNVIDLGAVTTHTSTQSAKGGQDVKTYSYTQTIALGLVEATTIDGTATPIGGLSRVWENGRLVFDIRPQQAGEADKTFANRLTAASVYAEKFVLYLGDEEQLADPTLETLHGVGKVPAFRGLAYIVYPDRQLLDSQALRHPAFKFELFTLGELDCTDKVDLSNEVLYPWSEAGMPVNELNVNTFRIETVDPSAPFAGSLDNGGSLGYPTLAEAFAEVERCYGISVSSYLGYGMPGSDVEVKSDIDASGGALIVTHGPTDPPSLTMSFTAVSPTSFFASTAEFNPSTGGWLGTPGITGWESLTTRLVTDIPYDPAADPQPYPPWPAPWLAGSAYTGFYWYFSFGDAVIRVFRNPATPIDPCTGLAQTVPGFAMIDGLLVECGPWTKLTGGNWLVLQQFFSGNYPPALTPYPLNPALADSDPLNTEAFWTAAYTAAVATGDIPAGFTYSAGGGGGPGTYPVEQSFIYSRSYRECTAASLGLVDLQTIVVALCHRCGLSAVDASDLADVSVRGYAINAQMSVKNAIDPLRSVGFFDVIESGSNLVFRTRGKAVVATLTSDDLGVFEESAGAPPPAIAVTRMQDVDLPRCVRVNYIAVSRDYENGQQLSPTRTTTLSVNDVDVNLAIALDDDQAAQIASVLWASMWTEALSCSFALDQSFSRLEPGDCVAIPIDGKTERVRIIDITDSAGVLRKINAVLDNDAAYVSSAVASAPQRAASTVLIYAGSTLVFLDLPALRDQDDNAGFYAGVIASGGGVWGGAVIYQSNQTGSTYAQAASVTQPLTVGTITTPPLDADYGTWDEGSQLTVTVLSTQAFESLSDADVLAGGNLMAIGQAGRYELIQFGVAEQLSATSWRLTHLLRGRRGTEYLIGGTINNDKAVLLTAGSLADISLQNAQIGASLNYRAVTIGSSAAAAAAVPFTGHGRRLQTFSPVDITFADDGSGDITIAWDRRDRLGHELPASGATLPMSESAQAFSVEVVVSSAIVHTFAVSGSATSVVYSAAAQSSDGIGSPTAFTVKIYQLSATLGRGPAGVAASGSVMLGSGV